jgi:peptidyl-prolyl cis-trans isomerase SurA
MLSDAFRDTVIRFVLRPQILSLMAKKFSEDGSAQNGGVLGWMGPGDLVPPFEIAMNRLQIGEVSDPVKTEFGWHLIQVLERRDAQLTVEKQREFARAAIRERKFEQAYQDWLRTITRYSNSQDFERG